MAVTPYNLGKRKGPDDLAAADLRVLLLRAGYTVDPDHNHVANLSTGTYEFDGTNYARKVLANKAVTQDDTNDRALLTCDAVAYTALGAGSSAPTAAVVYVFVTNDADSYLVAHYTITGTPNGNDATLTWPSGLLEYV